MRGEMRTPERQRPKAPPHFFSGFAARRRGRRGTRPQAQHLEQRSSAGRGPWHGTGDGPFRAGHNPGGGGGCGSGGGSGCSFGGGLHFFGVAGRRHHGHQRHIGRADDADALGQRHFVEMLGMADVELGNIDVDRFRNGVGRAHHLDGVGDDIDRAAALDAGRGLGAEHVHRNFHADGGAFRHAQEVDVHRQVLDGVELEVARDDAVLLAVDVELVERGEEAPGIDALAQLIVLDQHHHRGLVLAVDNARHVAGVTCCPCGPLAGFRARRRFHLLHGCHVGTSSNPMEKAAFSAALRTRQASRGAGGRVSGGL